MHKKGFISIVGLLIIIVSVGLFLIMVYDRVILNNIAEDKCTEKGYEFYQNCLSKEHSFL